MANVDLFCFVLNSKQGLSTVGLKRVAEDDEQQDGPGGSAKRILTEDQARPPLSRGDSLPTVPFAADRQPNFKDKHPVRAPSFDTATFKAGSKCSHFLSSSSLSPNRNSFIYYTLIISC